MKQRPAMIAIAVIMSGLLCACTTGRAPDGPTASTAPPLAAATRARSTTVTTEMKGFYRRYVAAVRQSHAAAEALVRSHVAGWYLPILDAPPGAAVDPVDCGLRGVVTDWSFKQVGVLGGQVVIAIGSRPRSAEQELWIVVTAAPATGKITGITCSIGGADVTRIGARDAAVSLYSYYIRARRQGASAPAVVARLLEGGPTSGSSYLRQVRYAFARQELTHDPVTCAAKGVPDVAVGPPRIVAGRTVGVIMASAHRIRVVVTIVLSAKGWTVGDIACPRRSVATAAR